MSVLKLVADDYIRVCIRVYQQYGCDRPGKDLGRWPRTRHDRSWQRVKVVIEKSTYMSPWETQGTVPISILVRIHTCIKLSSRCS